MPYEALRRSLSEITNRGAVTLGALKVYLLLIAWRPNQRGPALDVLLNHTLIRLSINEGRTPGEPQGRHNVYTLLGLTL